MSDNAFSTIVVTENARLSFRRYFVEMQARPKVQKIEFDSFNGASATDEVIGAFKAADAIVVCPNPLSESRDASVGRYRGP
jgi:LPPG:FO 2-phospho-L-lactate transferase